MAFLKSVGAGRSVGGLCRQEGEIRLRCLRRDWSSNVRAGFYPTACLVLDLGGACRSHPVPYGHLGFLYCTHVPPDLVLKK